MHTRVRVSVLTDASLAILLVRTYAYYNRNKYVLAVLSCMLSTVLAYQLWVDIRAMLRAYTATSYVLMLTGMQLFHS